MTNTEMKELLKNFKNKEAKLRLKEILKRKKEIELNNLIPEEYNINITPVYSEGGKSNNIISKTENAIVKKDSKIEKLKEEIKVLEKEIEILKLEVEEMNVRLGTLTYIEKEILVDYYVNENTLEDIGNITYYRIRQQTRSAKTVKRLIENATKKLCEI